MGSLRCAVLAGYSQNSLSCDLLGLRSRAYLQSSVVHSLGSSVFSATLFIPQMPFSRMYRGHLQLYRLVAPCQRKRMSKVTSSLGSDGRAKAGLSWYF